MKSSKFILAAMYFLLLLVLPIGRGYGESHVMKNNSSYPEDSLVIRNQFGAPIIDAEGRRINYTHEELRAQEQAWRLRQPLYTNTGRGGYSMPQTTVSPASGSMATWGYAAFGFYIGTTGITFDIVDGNPEIYMSSRENNLQDFWYTLRYNNASKKYEQSFVSHVFNTPGIGLIAALRVADVTGDSRKEIVVAVRNGRVFLYDQVTKNFLKEIELDLYNSTTLDYLEVADVDGDMKNDFIIGTRKSLVVNSADGNRLWELGKGVENLAVGQMDDDSALEIAIRESLYSTGSVSVIDCSSHSIQWSFDNKPGFLLEAVDFDKDGRDELIVGDDWNNTLMAYDVEAQLSKWVIATPGDHAAIAVADIDNDSVVEILLGQNQFGNIYAYDTVTLEQEWFVENPLYGISDIVVGDADNDGRNELMWASGHSCTCEDRFFVANWETKQIEWENIHLDGPIVGPEFGDLDGDGKEEFVIISHKSDAGLKSGRIVVFDTNGKLLVKSAPIGGRYDSGRLNSFKLFDVDGDGKQEIIVAGIKSRDPAIHIFDFTSDNTLSLNWFKSTKITQICNSFQSVSAGDIDNDGQIEVVGIVACCDYNNKFLFTFDYNSGFEEWRTVVPSGAAGKFINIEVSDIDNDGYMEIITQGQEENAHVYNSRTGELKTVLDGPFTTMSVVNSGSTSQYLALGTPNGEIQLFNCDGGNYRKIFDKNFVDTPIDGISKDSTYDELIFGSGGTLKIGNSNGTIRWTSANYGKPYGKKVVLHPDGNLIYSAGAYSVNAFEYTPVASAPSIKVISPNGNETLRVGTSYPISWSTVGAVGDVKIENSIDNGGTWSTITGSTFNDGKYSWTVPNTTSENCLVRISDVAGPVQGQSDNSFRIVGQPGIIVTSPNGGESWEGSSTHPITWSYTGNIANVKLEYSIDGGNTWSIITNSTPNTGSFNWTVPNTPHWNCFVRVSDAEGSDVDQGDFAFIIDPERVITITFPKGGDTWRGDTIRSIVWNTIGDIVSVRLEYSADNGNSWNIITNSTQNIGRYKWSVPNNISSSSCFIRVSDIKGDVVEQVDAPFSILRTYSITVISPNGGETWKTGENFTITWSSQGITGDVAIDLYKNGIFHTSIGTAPGADGNLTWSVPVFTDIGNNYTVKVSQGQYEDVSDGDFFIAGYQPYADFNGDGKTDILWRYSGSPSEGINMVWLMDGVTKIGSNRWVEPEEDLNWKPVGTGDFNNDDKTDILFRYYGTGNMAGRNKVWFMDGIKKIGEAYLQRVVDVNWRIEGTGDFNNDGKTDIMWRYYGSPSEGINMIWLMDGVTKIGGNNWIQRVIDVGWKMVGSGDFNNDGKCDILWRYYSSPSEGINMIWHMDGLTKIGKNVWLPRQADLDWDIGGTGDFNGDGKTDILWRKYGTEAKKGTNMVWYMDGKTRLGSPGYLPFLGNVCWKIVN
jgi:hypothetical protein